ncbi:MAG: hypothetical protein ACYDAR_12175 [Thermomicrobiales bacterium]
MTTNAALFLRRLCVSVLRGKHISPFSVTPDALASVRRHIATTGEGAGLTRAETEAAVDELDAAGYIAIDGAEVTVTPFGARWYAGHLPPRRKA